MARLTFLGTADNYLFETTAQGYHKNADEAKTLTFSDGTNPVTVLVDGVEVSSVDVPAGELPPFVQGPDGLDILYVDAGGGAVPVGPVGAGVTSYNDLTDLPTIPSSATDVGAEPAGLSTATNAALAGTYVRVNPNALVANLPRPFYMGHRGGGSYLAPEYTRAALDMAAAYGVDVIEVDVRTLADGTLVLNHDTTVDRTLDGTGNVSDQTAARWRTMTTKSTALMGYGTWPTERPMFLEELLRVAGNRQTLMLQVDSPSATIADVDALVEKVGVHKGSVLIQTFNQTIAADAVTRGYPATLLSELTVAVDYASVAADGIMALCVNQDNLTPTILANAQAAGLEVWVYTVNSKAKHDAWVAAGVTGFVTDDPPYIAGKYPARSTDAFTAQAFMPGHHATRSYRGTFAAPNAWGWDKLAGNVSYDRLPITPPDPTSYTLDFEANIADDNGTATNWFAVSLMSEDTFTDGGGIVSGADGVNFLVRANNTMGAIKFVDNTWTAWLAQNINVTGFALNTWLPYRIVVTPTTVRIERKDTGQGQTINYSDARPLRYLHLGRSTAGVWFRNIKFT